MKPAIIIAVGLALATATAGTADAWRGAVGPRGGAAVAGPRGVAVRGPGGGAAAVGRYGGAAVRGPGGNVAVRGGYGGAYYGGRWGMVPVPSLLAWQSVPPLVPQPPHHIIILAATRITVRHLTNSYMADNWRRGFGQSQCSSFAFRAFCVDCFCSHYYRYLVGVRWS
jgi:hypothetical protein